MFDKEKMKYSENNEFTKLLYGRNQFQYSVDKIELPVGFIKYHKTNFSNYFKIKKSNFKGRKILETGCGPGKHAVVLSLMGANVTAVDLSLDNIQKGEKLKKFYNLSNLSFIQHDLMKPLDYKNKFDLISSHNWIQHTENPSTVLKNLVSGLKEGGRLYISTYHANTFRFFITQIARTMLKREYYELMYNLVKFHFPTGFKEFNNPDDICLENIFDDFFVPYCHTTTYDIVINDAKKLGLVPITEIPDLKQLYSLDNIPLRIGLEKKEYKDFTKRRFKFTKPVDEFAANLPFFISESIKLSKKTSKYLNKLDDAYINCSFCLGLYRIRAQTCKMDNPKEKHQILQQYLEATLLNSTKSISSIYDTAKMYE
jgi:2-polyprenyl-3-methyl-5-hydroxy-6-metoxy-1,4-benzoquinol methylase